MNIVITGVSQGIGLETVLKVAQLGNHTIVGIARNKKALAELKNKLPNSVFYGIEFDLSEIFVKGTELVSQIRQIMPEVNVLINNAGTLIRQPYTEFSAEEIQALFTINVYAPAELMKILSRYMGLTQRAHVVNIGSMAGFQGSSKFSGLSWYSASKAALICLTECLSAEYKDKNIAFNCLALGAVQTDMLAKAFPNYKAPVTPSEMGDYIANFALTAHNVMNGTVVAVNMSNP